MIFFDSNVIIDFFVKKFSNGKENNKHFRAVKLWKTINETKIISNLVRVEVINILYLTHQKNKEFIEKVNSSLLNDFEIIDDSEYYDEGFEKLQKYNKKISINECVYLAIMEDYGIEKIASFDTNFDNHEVKRIY
jgi:predicted nucleic acid-binding protein